MNESRIFRPFKPFTFAWTNPIKFADSHFLTRSCPQTVMTCTISFMCVASYESSGQIVRRLNLRRHFCQGLKVRATVGPFKTKSVFQLIFRDEYILLPQLFAIFLSFAPHAYLSSGRARTLDGLDSTTAATQLGWSLFPFLINLAFYPATYGSSSFSVHFATFGAFWPCFCRKVLCCCE